MNKNYFNKLKNKILLFLVFFSTSVFAQETSSQFQVDYLGNKQTIIHPKQSLRYILLPIEEKTKESQFSIILHGRVIKTINVHLAIDKVDYYVPVNISRYDCKLLLFRSKGVPKSAICWHDMKLSNVFDVKNREYYRPIYHFTPIYGWMNDPNGLVYKDGIYHLFYQYNPYGSMWGNMHWGHATSTDLINWQYKPIAIEPDALGTIFSGSCVIDKYNTAGFGKGAIVALYTSASDNQMQCLAYSLDNGSTFNKYENNPVLTSINRDFRDPKVFWDNEIDRWIMVLAVGQKMQIYSSINLKKWKYESSFGQGYGCHKGVWECPDLFKLKVPGQDIEKWVMLCNINPGGPFGGSATQYFIGTFDGHKFTCDSKPSVTKWMDYGKDCYATVTFNNAPEGRCIALAWMNNWQYANQVPTLQYRSSNTLPRDLSLFEYNNEVYLASTPSPELDAIRGKKCAKLKDVCELEVAINSQLQPTIITLFNDNSEKVIISYKPNLHTLSMNRESSGDVSFSDAFKSVTTAPTFGIISHLRIFIDKSSIEIFDAEGKVVMTNLVFPTKAYNNVNIKGCASISIYKIK